LSLDEAVRLSLIDQPIRSGHEAVINANERQAIAAAPVPDFSTDKEGRERSSPSLGQPLPKRQLFARLCLGRVAIFLSHFLESLALAGILAFAGILRALARGLTLTRIYAVAMDLGFIGASRGERTNTEQKRGGRGNRGAGDGLGHLHLKFLLMIDDRG
jgi:hypothetical protein